MAKNNIKKPMREIRSNLRKEIFLYKLFETMSKSKLTKESKEKLAIICDKFLEKQINTSIVDDIKIYMVGLIHNKLCELGADSKDNYTFIDFNTPEYILNDFDKILWEKKLENIYISSNLAIGNICPTELEMLDAIEVFLSKYVKGVSSSFSDIYEDFILNESLQFTYDIVIDFIMKRI